LYIALEGIPVPPLCSSALFHLLLRSCASNVAMSDNRSWPFNLMLRPD
jgi:hypothetical protein